MSAPPTLADFATLRLTYDSLGKAIAQWPTQVALMQLGKPTEAQTAIEGLPDSTLTRLSDAAAAPSVASFKRSRDDTLRFLYLARGGNKYESQAVGLQYMEDARLAAIASQEQLELLAKRWGAL